MDNVISFDRSAFIDIDPKLMLEEVSKKKDIKHVFVLTEQEDGSLCFYSSVLDTAVMLMWVELWKYHLLSGAFE